MGPNRTLQMQDQSLDFFPKKSNRPKWHMEPKFLETGAQLCSTYSMTTEEVKNVIISVERIHELYELFGKEAVQRRRSWFCDKNVDRGLRTRTLQTNWDLYNSIHSLMRIVSKNGEGSWAKILKWKFAAFFSFHRGEDIPPLPSVEKDECPKYNKALKKWLRPQCLLGGGCADFLVVLRNGSYDHFMEFTDTVQQLKKGMPSVPESMIDDSIRATVKQLTSPPSTLETPLVFGGPHVAQWYTPDLEDPYGPVDCSNIIIKEQLRRTVRELFGGFKLSLEDLEEPFFPSTSANYMRSRSNGGAVSELYDRYDLGHEDSFLDQGLTVGRFFNHVPTHYFDLGEKERRDNIKREDLLGEKYTEDGDFLILDATRFESRWKNLYWSIFKDAITEVPLVAPVGLSEPLKVRVISKGPPLLYTALKPMQKILWRTLKKHRVFNLIGRYVLPEDIDICLGKLEEDEIAVSGDYKASTDNLHSWVSETILDELMICINENLSSEELGQFPVDFLKNLGALLKKALTKHIFEFEGVQSPQLEGQLMGSIISFPFLCLANAAICRYAIEKSYNRTFSLIARRGFDLAPLLVNGDDCLFRGPIRSIRSLWETLGSNAGLSSSVGKTYFNSTFCTINSTIFQWDGAHWIERKYINLGLLHGQRRSQAQGQSAFQGTSQLGVLCRELKRSCPPRLWPSVKKRFLLLNKEELTKYKVPWMVPEWLGGIGLPIDSTDEISELDRKLCTVLKRFYGDPKYRVTKQSQAALWKQHKLVERRLNDLGLTEVNFENCVIQDGEQVALEESFSKAYKYMTIDLLFHRRIDDLIESKELAATCAMKRNEKSYCTARKYLEMSVRKGFDLIEPMCDDEMAYEKKDSFYPVAVRDLPWFSQPRGEL